MTQQSRGLLERIDGISKRRVEGLPKHAAAVLEALVDGLGIERIVLHMGCARASSSRP